MKISAIHECMNIFIWGDILLQKWDSLQKMKSKEDFKAIKTPCQLEKDFRLPYYRQLINYGLNTYHTT